MHGNWKQQSVKRRDERSSKSPKEFSRHLGPKKNKRRWCKGQVGMEHEPKCVDDPRDPTWKNLVCEKCHRKMDLFIPWPGVSKPSWVP